MPVKLPVWDQRMILLMRHCIDLELCDSQKEFLESIGFNPTNLKDVKSGSRSFTIEQMIAAATKYRVSIDWIAGLSKEMKRKKATDPLSVLKDAVRNMEAEIKLSK